MILSTTDQRRMAHQRAAGDKIARLKVGGFLMEMGTGKTLTAGYVAAEKVAQGKASRLVWLCPNSAKLTIAREMGKWFSGSVYVFGDSTRVGNIPQADIHIVGTESLSSSLRIADALAHVADAAAMVVDESHQIKGHDAIRTRRIIDIGHRKARYRYVASGTAVCQGIEDLYSQMLFMSPKVLRYRSFREFERHHLDYTDEWPRRICRRHNARYVYAAMAPYVFQVKKEECLDLPARTETSAWVSMSEQQRELYDEAKTEILMDVDAFTFGVPTVYRLFTALQQIVSGWWRWKGETIEVFNSPEENPRLQRLLDVVAEIDPDRKVVIWAKYLREVDEITAALAAIYGLEAVRQFCGRQSPAERDASLTAFRGPARFLVATQSSGGLAVDMTAAHYAVYYSNTFKNSDRLQTMDRLHRPGQTMPVTYTDIVMDRSIDEVIMRCLSRRRDVVTEFQMAIQHIREAKTKAEAQFRMAEFVGAL